MRTFVLFHRSGIVFLLSCLILLSGGAGFSQAESGGAVARDGDSVKIHFTCWLPDGRVAATTEEVVSKNPDMPKSEIFYERVFGHSVDISYEPVTVKAVAKPPEPPNGLPSFEEEIAVRIGHEIVGKKAGEDYRIRLEPMPHFVDPEFRFWRIDRVRIRPLVQKTKISLFSVEGKTPEIGQRQRFQGVDTAEVIAVDDTHVTVRLIEPPKGKRFLTRYGLYTDIRFESDQSVAVIDAVVGQLARQWASVGKVSAVDEQSITIDFGYGFGGKPLACDVSIESITSTNPSPAE